MDIVIPVAVALLAALGLLHPLVRPPLLALDEGGGPWSKLAALEERKLLIYGAIRETNFDFRTDKVGEEDYRREIELLKKQAIEVVVEIEALRSQVPHATKSLEKSISTARQRVLQAELDASEPATDHATPTDMTAAGVASLAAASFCTSCGHATAPEDRFCAACGAGLKVT